ncbi:helix-turn-helix domain-containing protein [Providencia sneebia]|uniref:Fimbrial operon regulator n=1 Tax=Providencia sneebia DSM 19967 TaxID=1141660 RepID=K8W5J7_9GAMM|nr:helix-turn-helix transcriptional regulator [Providencia sneebia]EKT55853.1 fimbrial operon regulator [Providencia sneebia DSM 19967]
MRENEPLSNNIGKMLKCYRRRTGLTGSQLAKRINVSQQQISRYENGVNNITFDRLVILFNALEMDGSDIEFFFEEIKRFIDSEEYKKRSFVNF